MVEVVQQDTQVQYIQFNFLNMATYDYSKYSKVKSPTGFDIYEGSNKLSYEQAKPMFASGFNVDFIKEASQAPTQPITQSQTQMPTGAPTSMPAQPGLSKVATQSVGPDGKPIFDVFAGQQHISDPNDPRLKGVNIEQLPTGQAPQGFKSKFEQGFDNAKGQLGNPDISEGGQGRALVSSFTDNQNDTKALGFLQGDEFFTNLTKTFQEFVNPENQRASLADTYNQMIKDSGIEAMDMELINTKNIIEGSEEDIRTEITKAGGFATESQVLALTNSRNKQLIKNYNTLLETRNAKEKYLNTLIGLESQDREAADRRFEQAFNMQTQIADLGMKMQQNAVNSLDRVQKAIGWDGILAATQNDPYMMGLVEKTYGMPSGGLVYAAQQAELERYQEQQQYELDVASKMSTIANVESQIADRELMRPYDIAVKQSQLQTDAAQRANIQSQIESRRIQDAKDLQNLQGQPVQELAMNKSNVDLVGNLLKDSNLKGAVGPNRLARVSLKNVFTGGKSNFIAGVEQLRSQLNLDTLIRAKSQGATFGALSDQELKILSNAGTKLGTWALKDKNGNVTGYNASEKDFKEELTKVNNFAKLDYILKGGEPTEVGAQIMNDGTIWTKNSDGTMTKLR